MASKNAGMHRNSDECYLSYVGISQDIAPPQAFQNGGAGDGSNRNHDCYKQLVACGVRLIPSGLFVRNEECKISLESVKADKLTG